GPRPGARRRRAARRALRVLRRALRDRARRSVGSAPASRAAPLMDVALFVPCYVDELAPDVAWSTLRVLERAGCRVHYDPRPGCSGQPFLNRGARAEARRFAEDHLARFAEADAVVSPSASCVATVRHRYAALGATGAREQAGRTFELAEFLVRVLGKTALGARFPYRVALLQSCHGLRELGLGTPSERVAAAAPGPVER